MRPEDPAVDRSSIPPGPRARPVPGGSRPPRGRAFARLFLRSFVTGALAWPPAAGATGPPDGNGPLPASPLGPSPEDIPAVEAVFVVPDFGEFTVRFHREDAPNHVAHFLILAHEGFFDGLEFHRVIPGYLVQTGDPATRPDSDGSGSGSRPGDPRADDSPYRLPEEPTEATHVRGTVSMAWRGDRPGTAETQWFIALADVPALDGRATPIGHVVEGLDVVERISQVSTGRHRRPREPVRIAEVRLKGESPSGDEADGDSEVDSGDDPADDRSG